MNLTQAELAVSALLTRPRLLISCLSLPLDPAVFSESSFGSPLLESVTSTTIDYFRKYSAVPSREVMQSMLPQSMQTKSNLRRLRAMYTASKKVTSDEWVIDVVESVHRQHAVKSVLFESFEALQRGETHVDLDAVSRALNLSVRRAKDGEFLKLDIGKRVHSYLFDDVSDAVPTGISHVDQLIGGGLEPGELGVLMAPSKTGKSHGLIHIGAHAASLANGLRVLHFSCEMNTRKVLERYDRRVSGGVGYKYFRKEPPKFINRLKRRMRDMVTGDVFVRSYPTRTLTLSMMKEQTDALIAKGFPPQLVIVDYGDIMKAERRTDSRREAEASCFEDLRTYAGVYDVPVWTATQVNREGSKRDRPLVEDVGESWEKIQILDVLLVLGQTEEEAAKNEASTYVFQRDEESGRVIDMKVDKGYSYFKSVGVRSAETVQKPRRKKDKEAAAHDRIKERMAAKKDD